MKEIKYRHIDLLEGQYLNEVEPFKSTGIPSDCILHKTITGCGVTTLEFKYTKRNSIIVLPNVPVIVNNPHHTEPPIRSKVSHQSGESEPPQKGGQTGGFR
jgi:hypothetical protein